VGGEAPVTPVSSPDSSSLDLSYKPCDNRDQLRYHLLVALIIMLLLLMMQLEKLGCIAFDKNLMFLILLRNGKL
jgi:hypothetical protein